MHYRQFLGNRYVAKDNFYTSLFIKIE